jgi:hypothetical protein
MKKRLSIRLSTPLARKLEFVAGRSSGGKSALIEEALRARLEPEQVPGIDEVLIRRLNELNRAIGSIARDIAVVTETLALFVRYFLTITPPLPQGEQEPARLLGKQRFQVFVAQVGRRLAGEQRLFSEVLETIAGNEPDLFAVAADDAREAARANAAASVADAAETPEAPKQDQRAPENNDHG